MTAPLTSQANRACPALSTLIAPTTSAFSSKPHATHANLACVWRFATDTWPQHGHLRLVFCGGMALRHLALILHPGVMENSVPSMGPGIKPKR